MPSYALLVHSQMLSLMLLNADVVLMRVPKLLMIAQQ